MSIYRMLPRCRGMDLQRPRKDIWSWKSCMHVDCTVAIIADFTARKLKSMNVFVEKIISTAKNCLSQLQVCETVNWTNLKIYRNWQESSLLFALNNLIEKSGWRRWTRGSCQHVLICPNCRWQAVYEISRVDGFSVVVYNKLWHFWMQHRDALRRQSDDVAHTRFYCPQERSAWKQSALNCLSSSVLHHNDDKIDGVVLKMTSRRSH
jgi:hypothetical protein